MKIDPVIPERSTGGAGGSAGVISGWLLLDQLCAVVDGRPVKQGHVLFVRLPDVISGFHQLLAAFQDSKPDGSHTQHTDHTHTQHTDHTHGCAEGPPGPTPHACLLTENQIAELLLLFCANMQIPV